MELKPLTIGECRKIIQDTDGLGDERIEEIRDALYGLVEHVFDEAINKAHIDSIKKPSAL